MDISTQSQYKSDVCVEKFESCIDMLALLLDQRYTRRKSA